MPLPNPHFSARWTPDFDERIYPAHKIATVVRTLQGAGVDVPLLLSGSGLTQERLGSASTRISYGQMVVVFRNALRHSPLEDFALRAGHLMRVTSYGMYGYAMMSSPSREVALSFAHKYHRVMGPVAQMSLVIDSEDVVFTYDPIMSRDAGEALYRVSLEFVFASHLRLNRDLYGPSFHFDRVRLAFPAPEHAEAYSRWLGCPVEFDQPFSQVSYTSAWLSEPMPYFDPITNAMARESCEEVIAKIDSTESVGSLARRVLVENPGQFPNIEAMAARLSMNPRMLHRKLAAEQTTYREQLAEVRMTLAIAYLQKTDMTNDDIASRLGYSDASNFRHAFVRWTGKRPSDYRS